MRGSMVRRRTDPVHTGVVTSVNLSWKTATVRWHSVERTHLFGQRSGTLEFNVPVDELEAAEEWK